MPKALIERLFGFDKEDPRFELLENEHGEPKLFAGWQDAEKVSNRNEERIPDDLNDIIHALKADFSSDLNKDVIFRQFLIAGSFKALLVCMNGMADAALINAFILRPLMELNPIGTEDASADELVSELMLSAIEIGEVKRESDPAAVKSGILDGMTALFIDGAEGCLLLETRGYEKRSIGSAENEKTVFGSKESFTESLRTNVTLIRRIIRTEDLVVEIKPSGGRNRTSSALVYRDGFTNPSLIAEVKRRLARIRVNNLLSSGVTDQLIEDSSILPIPKSLSTERPDRACSHIMQGCICLITEGSPLAVVLPVTFASLMASPEDVYLRKPLGNILRSVRYAGAVISVLLPGYFLALALYHQGSLTTEVLSTVIASRKMVFEPMAIEMILLLLVFQLIREAGLRVPGSIGQAIGIIGGLIMGQAAVAANLASSVVLIIVALSGLGNFCIPDYSTQISAAYLRMSLVIAAWLGGLLAMTSAMLVFIALLASTKSFGVPFLAPFAPKTGTKRPAVLRGSIGMNKRAEDYLNTGDDERIR